MPGNSSRRPPRSRSPVTRWASVPTWEETMLRVDGLDVAYWDLQVLWGLCLEVKPGSTVALVGPNGAGKTTTLMTIAGLMRPRQGQIHFSGTRIDTAPPHQIVHLGPPLQPER